MVTDFDKTFGEGRDLYYTLNDYWAAPSGSGALAYTWEDKPHRLIYDLIAYIVFLEKKMENMTEPRFKKGDRVTSVYFDATAVVIDVLDYKIMVQWDDENEEDSEFPRMFHPDDGFVKIED